MRMHIDTYTRVWPVRHLLIYSISMLQVTDLIGTYLMCTYLLT